MKSTIEIKKQSSTSGKMVLCRVCEEYITLETFENHAQKCITFNRLQTKVHFSDEKLKSV
jgi:hypothetical protein